MRTFNSLFLCAFAFAATAACVVLDAGCSSNDNGGGFDDGGSDSGAADSTVGADSHAPDSGSVPDTGAQETSTIDTGVSETSLDGTGVSDGMMEGGETDAGEDSGHAEAGSDSGHEEAGSDSGHEEAGSDSGHDGGESDAGMDSGPIEASVDSGQADAAEDGGTTDAGHDGAQTEEGGTDASDSGSPDTGTDAPTYTFSNPLQVDVSSILNVNTIVGSVSGGMALTPVDGPGGVTGYDFPTLAEAMKLTDAGAAGLPNNAFFASNGTTIPNVQLSWNDDQVHPIATPNTVIFSGTAGTAVAFNVPQAKYNQVQIYATGGNGAGSLAITLTYTTGTPVMTTMALPDWCATTASANEYALGDRVARVQNGTAYNPNPLCGLWAIDLGPDTARDLSSVSITDTGAANSYFAFYGATAW
jgi:hypothetical protein